MHERGDLVLPRPEERVSDVPAVELAHGEQVDHGDEETRPRSEGHGTEFEIHARTHLRTEGTLHEPEEERRAELGHLGEGVVVARPGERAGPRLAMQGGMKRIQKIQAFSAAALTCAALAGCGAAVDPEQSEEGASIYHTDSTLTGCHGAASSSIPSSGMYYLTTFGGPGDSQPMSCGSNTNNGTWYYAASRQR